jgi:hypothetical protein
MQRPVAAAAFQASECPSVVARRGCPRRACRTAVNTIGVVSIPDQVPPSRWEDLQAVFLSEPGYTSALSLAVYLVVGGALAMYLRFLYRWSSPQTSADSIARVFPLLTLVTIAVIAVVKSSLALSLGLVGALSIVRFRAAIKDPEELVYLFLCIGVGLALGAEQPWLALTLVVVATVFIAVFDRFRPAARAGDGYLTIVGSAADYFLVDAKSTALEHVRSIWPRLTLQRCEVDGSEGQLRLQLHHVTDEASAQIVADVAARLPGCEVSYVKATAML